jgi:hypothetical protein
MVLTGMPVYLTLFELVCDRLPDKFLPVVHSFDLPLGFEHLSFFPGAVGRSLELSKHRANFPPQTGLEKLGDRPVVSSRNHRGGACVLLTSRLCAVSVALMLL